MRERQRNVLLALASVVLSLGLAELALRLFVPPASPSFEHRMHRIPHPTLGWVLEPGASYVYRIPETEVRVVYNSAGRRDVERPTTSDGKTYRIVVLGDSFMEAYSVDLEDSFARRLQGLTDRAGFSAEVINLGVGGYGTLQSYLAFLEAASYAPDLVVLAFYVHNDVRDNSLELETLRVRQRRLARPYLETDGHGWAISEIDFEQSRARYEAGLAGREAQTPLEARVRIARLVGETIRGAAREDDLLAHQSQLYDVGIHYCVEPPEISRAWATTRRILRRLKADVRSAGGELILFTVPGMLEVDRDAADDRLSRSPNPELVCFDEAPGYRRLAAMAEGEGIPFVDLLPTFRTAWGSDRDPLFNRSDRHWTPSAHALAAQTVFESLSKSVQSFPSVDREGETRRQATTP